MRSAFVLGGTGLIGRALVPSLLHRGFEVTVGTRTGPSKPAGDFRHVRVDRASDDDFASATRGDYDLVVDVVAYSEHHAEQLTRLDGRVGGLVVVSSAAVYADEDGNTLLGSAKGTSDPIPESHAVVAPVPDGSDYAGGKVAVERTLLESGLPVTILRPGAIFGPGDRASREWHFVKRALDERRFVILAHEGTSLFHHVSSANVAEMTVLAGENPGTRVVNCGDPDPLNVRQIADAISDHLDHESEVVTVPGPPQGIVGDTPWTAPHPFLLDLSVARRELGFSGAPDHQASLGETIRWLVEETTNRAWEEALPAAATNYSSLFDYEAEDRFLEDLHRQ